MSSLRMRFVDLPHVYLHPVISSVMYPSYKDFGEICSSRDFAGMGQ